MTVPYWVQDAVFYQIFPDRFANGDPSNDPPNVQPWGTKPTGTGFQGGDLRGITQKIDYLLDLGITAIYLNPIFQASSNHRYNTFDYYRIDPKLGDLKDFHALLEVAHRNSIRVILDGVFNHCGRGFYPFVDLLENKEDSPYRNWFHPLRFPIDAYSPGEAKDYLAWWGFKSLPKFNTSEPEVRKYLIGVARYWIEQGADGWRLDVPNEIDDDTFWDEFRSAVKSVNEDAYLVGEIWTADKRWVGDQHFDGLMNYPVRDCLLNIISAPEDEDITCADELTSLVDLYPRDNFYAMYVPLGSHDTKRIMTKLEGSTEKVKLAFMFQFAFPGAPAIYYGDEIGLQGGKDPDCRGAFPWDRRIWNSELRGFVKKLITLRKRQACLRRGDYIPLLADDRQHCYSFARSIGDEIIIFAMNASSEKADQQLPTDRLGWGEGQVVTDLLGGEEFLVSEGSILLSLPPWSGVWLSTSQIGLL
jgi:cyclomaltodextrinase